MSTTEEAREALEVLGREDIDHRNEHLIRRLRAFVDQADVAAFEKRLENARRAYDACREALEIERSQCMYADDEVGRLRELLEKAYDCLPDHLVLAHDIREALDGA